MWPLQGESLGWSGKGPQISKDPPWTFISWPNRNQLLTDQVIYCIKIICNLTLHNFTLQKILTNCKRITHIYFFSLHPNRLVLLCKMSLNTLATSSKTWQTTDTMCYFINNSSGGVGEPTPRKQRPSFTSPAMNQKHIPRPVCDFPWQTSRQCSSTVGHVTCGNNSIHKRSLPEPAKWR